MVYFGGKPSGGCERCRQRKIGCDKLPDGCTNCKKGGHECKGYRDALDLRFRDETQFVAQKAKEKSAKKKRQARSKASSSVASVGLSSAYASSSSSDSSGSTESSPNELFYSAIEVLQKPLKANQIAKVTEDGFSVFKDESLIILPTRSPARSLSPSLDDQAIGFFFTHHIINQDASLSEMDESFLATMKAVGLAGVSSFYRTPYLRIEARKGYQKAIQEVNQALLSPSTATSDSILMAIMLLGQFETVDTSPRSLLAWQNHINGAATVLKLRGAEKLKNAIQIRLFVQVTSSLIVSCMRSNIPLPDHIFELIEVASNYADNNDTTWRFFYLQVMVAKFRGEALKKVFEDPFSVLEDAIRLDGLCLNFFTPGDLLWSFRTTYTDVYPDLILFGQFHTYEVFMSSQLWTGLRALRITLNEVIRRILLTGFSSKPPLFSALEYAAQFQTSTDALYALQIDVLASLPQHLGVSPESIANVAPGTAFLDNDDISPPLFPWSQFSRAYIYNPTHPNHAILKHAVYSESTHIPMLRGFGGYLLPWLLYLAGNVSISRPEVQQSVLRILRWVGTAMDIKQASVLADELERNISKPMV